MTRLRSVPPPESTRPAELLAKSAVLRRLELELRRRLDGQLSADRLTPLPGPGSERAGARRYEPGDDARRIDWSLTARSMEPHVRITDADRELHTLVVADRSASLDFGTRAREKREVVLAAVAGFGLLTERGGNRLEVLMAGGDRLRHLPSRHGRVGLLAALSAVYDSPREQRPGSHADLAAALARAARTQHQRSQVVVASDFLDRSDWAAGLRRLALRHAVIAVHVTDPRELSLPDVGMLTVVDAETGRELHVQTRSARLRERYAAAAAARQQAITASIRRAGAQYLHLSTDRDWVLDLARFLTTGPVPA